MRLDICLALFVLGFQLQLPVNLFTFNQYPTTPLPLLTSYPPLAARVHNAHAQRELLNFIPLDLNFHCN